MKNKKTRKTVFVGLSGGVDSAVSAVLLQKQGYEVVGVFIRTWHPDFLECNEEEERRDAMRVAAHLNIPFLTFDLEDVYKKEVADYMIAEYKMGRTPNPDVMCNKEVKFGAFFKKAISMGADFVATGHYAQAKKEKISSAFLHPTGGTFRVQNLFFTQSLKENQKNFLSGRFHSKSGGKLKNSFDFLNLLKGKDPSKDQSYFLWTLGQEQLSKILFPIGHLKKTEVRKLAKKFKLPVAEKKDSQGICFLGDIDLKEFLKHYIKEKKGEVILVPSEAEGERHRVIGYHNGVVFSTLGERHGFTITKKSSSDGRYYVVAKDIKKNILIVSQNNKVQNFSAFLHPAGGTFRVQNSSDSSLALENVNWISEAPEPNKNYTAQVRYHGELLPCKIEAVGPERNRRIIFTKPVLAASGQSVVIYDKDVCLGGGVII